MKRIIGNYKLYEENEVYDLIKLNYRQFTFIVLNRVWDPRPVDQGFCEMVMQNIRL